MSNVKLIMYFVFMFFQQLLKFLIFLNVKKTFNFTIIRKTLYLHITHIQLL